VIKPKHQQAVLIEICLLQIQRVVPAAPVVLMHLVRADRAVSFRLFNSVQRGKLLKPLAHVRALGLGDFVEFGFESNECVPIQQVFYAADPPDGLVPLAA
jgi:hypothetical protein